MGKRPSMGGEAGGKPRKRVKVVHEAPTSEEINTSRQLKALLAPDQDPKKLRHGLQSFKVFLDHINNKDDGHGDRKQILDEYLASTKPRPEEDTPVYLSDIMEIWSNAGQTNNDNVLSAVPVVLALLLRILSQNLSQVPYGLGVCRTLLQKRQQELIARNLSADKGKEFIISPTLRLLREALCFDGGAVAKPIFRARSSTFKSLGRNMSIKYLGEGREDPKRPSARTNAVRFFLAALRLLHAEAKKELLSLKDIIAGLTKSIRDDAPSLVLEILDTLKTHVLLDEKVPREAKSRLLNSNTLTRIASLYTYPDDDSDADGGRSVDDVAHAFLLIACTPPSAGVLRQQSGFYPKGTEVIDDELLRYHHEDMSLENVVWMNKFRDEIPVRNYVLSEFIQSLRPWANTKQSELLVAIFKAAPELLADYFQKRRAFSFEPKLSATWIGYAALLFSAVTVDIPPFFGQTGSYFHLPPPTSVVLDNILPLPLNQKVLLRCLAQKFNLISFFATRILVLSLEKLDAALRLYQEAAGKNNTLWKAGARRLVDEFCQRCPSMKDIVNSYRSIPEDNLLHREAASRLLLRYYEVLPQVALIAKFDVSPFLVMSIKRLSKDDDDQSSEDRNLGLRELEHLLVIAGHSPGMRWFAKMEGLALSPFLTLLQLLIGSQQVISSEKLLDTINFVAEEQQLVLSREQLLRPGKGGRGLQPLVQSLSLLEKELVTDNATSAVWGYIDNCVTRCAASPIKYLEMMLDLLDSSFEKENIIGEEPQISPLTMAMVEQIPYALDSKSTDTVQRLARFINLYLASSKAAGEDSTLLGKVFSKLRAHFPEIVQKKTLKAFPSSPAFKEAELSQQESRMDMDSTESTDQAGKASPGKSLEQMLDQPLEHELDNSALHRWANKEADEIVEEGYAASLITLLASEHTSIRKEAVTNILKMAAKIQQSDYDEKEQSHLLLCELAETAKGNVDTTPLPSSIISFACHGLDVLKNPLHTMYAKVNSFLTSGPVWRLDRIPLVHEVLKEEPSEDDSYYAELSWLVSYLLDSLRTPADLALFHKKRVFEQLMSVADNPYMRSNLRIQILGLLYRATSIEGGSGTLMTRFGVMAWLESRQAEASGGGDEGWIYQALIKRMWETADRQRALVWSKGGIPDILGV